MLPHKKQAVPMSSPAAAFRAAMAQQPSTTATSANPSSAAARARLDAVRKARGDETAKKLKAVMAGLAPASATDSQPAEVHYTDSELPIGRSAQGNLGAAPLRPGAAMAFALDLAKLDRGSGGAVAERSPSCEVLEVSSGRHQPPPPSLVQPTPTVKKVTIVESPVPPDSSMDDVTGAPIQPFSPLPSLPEEVTRSLLGPLLSELESTRRDAIIAQLESMEASERSHVMGREADFRLRMAVTACHAFAALSASAHQALLSASAAHEATRADEVSVSDLRGELKAAEAAIARARRERDTAEDSRDVALERCGTLEAENTALKLELATLASNAEVAAVDRKLFTAPTQSPSPVRTSSGTDAVVAATVKCLAGLGRSWSDEGRELLSECSPTAPQVASLKDALSAATDAMAALAKDHAAAVDEAVELPAPIASAVRHVKGIGQVLRTLEQSLHDDAIARSREAAVRTQAHHALATRKLQRVAVRLAHEGIQTMTLRNSFTMWLYAVQQRRALIDAAMRRTTTTRDDGSVSAPRQELSPPLKSASGSPQRRSLSHVGSGLPADVPWLQSEVHRLRDMLRAAEIQHEIAVARFDAAVAVGELRDSATSQRIKRLTTQRRALLRFYGAVVSADEGRDQPSTIAQLAVRRCAGGDTPSTVAGRVAFLRWMSRTMARAFTTATAEVALREELRACLKLLQSQSAHTSRSGSVDTSPVTLRSSKAAAAAATSPSLSPRPHVPLPAQRRTSGPRRSVSADSLPSPVRTTAALPAQQPATRAVIGAVSSNASSPSLVLRPLRRPAAGQPSFSPATQQTAARRNPSTVGSPSASHTLPRTRTPPTRSAPTTVDVPQAPLTARGVGGSGRDRFLYGAEAAERSDSDGHGHGAGSRGRYVSFEDEYAAEAVDPWLDPEEDLTFMRYAANLRQQQQETRNKPFDDALRASARALRLRNGGQAPSTFDL